GFRQEAQDRRSRAVSRALRGPGFRESRGSEDRCPYGTGRM
ncbi:MAG: hypothetical protein AVDCRST_MAG02-389, partial [uncultured Rubrobacteraceae bacterium]